MESKPMRTERRLNQRPSKNTAGNPSFHLSPCTPSASATFSLSCSWWEGHWAEDGHRESRSSWGVARSAASLGLPIVDGEKGPQDPCCRRQEGCVSGPSGGSPARRRSLHEWTAHPCPGVPLPPGRCFRGNRYWGQSGREAGKRWVQEGNETGVNDAASDQGLECWDAARLEHFNLLSPLVPFEVYGGIYTHSINHTKQGGGIYSLF